MNLNWIEKNRFCTPSNSPSAPLVTSFYCSSNVDESVGSSKAQTSSSPIEISTTKTAALTQFPPQLDESVKTAHSSVSSAGPTPICSNSSIGAFTWQNSYWWLFTSSLSTFLWWLKSRFCNVLAPLTSIDDIDHHQTNIIDQFQDSKDNEVFEELMENADDSKRLDFHKPNKFSSYLVRSVSKSYPHSNP